nr:replication factor A protein 1-like [Ipomoea batatas]
MYEVPEVRGAQTSKSLELLFHDAEDNTLKCTVWDDHVSAILPYYNANLAEPLIVVIQLCRAKVVTGEVRITSSYDATQLWFNQTFSEFVDFRSKLATNTSPVKSISTTTVLSQSTSPSEFQSGAVIVSTLSDVFEVVEDNDFYVPTEIMGIEGSRKWFYISCMKAGCNKKLSDDEGFLKCSKCKGQFVEGTVRYKLLVRVVDRTGDAPFLLWDREVCVRIPPELEILSGMAMTFKIGFKKGTMRGPNSAYNVIRETSQDDEVQSPLPIDTGKRKMVDEEDSESVKKCLIDQFSTSKTTKKMKEVTVKQEKI